MYITSNIDSFGLVFASQFALITSVMVVIAFGFAQMIRNNVGQKKSEERFQSLRQNTSDIITVIAADGRVSYASTSIRRILGYQPQNWLGKYAFAYVHTDEQETAKKLLERSLHSPCIDIFGELQLQRSCGCWQNFQVIVNNQIHDPNIGGIVAIYRDLTERNQAEALLKESEQRFRQLAENIQAAFWMADLTTNKIIYISPGYEQIWGRPCQSIYNNPQTWLNTIFPQDRQRIIDAIEKQKWGGYNEEYRILWPDGSIRWIHDRAFPIRNQQGEVYRLAGIAEDITDRKRQEERLRLLESVVVNANDLVLITEAEPIDLPGPRILYVNEAFTRMTGYTPAEVLGKSPRILQGPKTDRAILDKIRTALKQWQPIVVELINYRKDRSEFWVELSLVPVADENGYYTHWVAVERDITDRKRVEVEIRKALFKEQELSELKSRFISMTSHEFRTPLATILASSDLLKQFSHILSEEKKIERLNKIQVEVKNMTKLLDDVLVFGKAEAGKLEVNPSYLNLKQFCQEMLEEIEITAGETHNLKFTCQEPREKDFLDEKLLRHILSNLLSNAVKYSPVGSTIYFDLIWQDRQVIFQVKDEGIGIPAADQKRLFEPFYRGSNVGNISGTGLGLAIINNAVNLCKGSITVDSKVNLGTTFTISIPTDKN